MIGSKSAARDPAADHSVQEGETFSRSKKADDTAP